MRAAVVHEAGGPDAISIEDIAVPEPGAGEVRIKVAYVAMNPLDAHARGARIDWMHPGFPFTPGFEYSGIVEKCGDGVDAALTGQRVASNGGWGGCAEFAVANAATLEMIPDGIDLQTGAVYSTCAYTAWLLVHSAARLQPGQSIAVHSAAGAVGAMLTQVAKSAGATVFALAGGDAKLEYAKQFGADHLVDYNDESWPARVVELNDGKGVDVIVDGNVGPHALRNFDAIAPFGNVIFIGATAGLGPDINISMLIGKGCSVTGFTQYQHQALSAGAEREATHAALISGDWRIPIEKVYSLDETAEAHRAWEARELTGRSLIEVGGDL
jgi:NADPH2:quinone reductase